MSSVGQALRDGLAAAQAKQFDRARALLERVTAETPEDPVAWFWLAIASPSADAAIPCLRRVLAIDPAHAQAREALIRLLVTHARALAAAGRRADARAHAAEACAVAPDVATVWQTLVAISDDQVERIDALRRVSELTPDDVQTRTRLRQALLARGVMIASTDRAEARRRFREAMALDPTDVRVRQALANLAESRSEWLDALRDLLASAPEHANARAALRNALVADAQALAATGHVDDACARLREAIEAAGPDVETLVNLAAVTPDEAEAERATEQAFALDPDDPRAIAAMDRLRAQRIDPATLEPPADAFARFGDAVDANEPQDPLVESESGFEAFAELSLAPSGPPPAAAASDPVPAVSDPPAVPMDPAPAVVAAAPPPELEGAFDAAIHVPLDEILSEAPVPEPPAAAAAPTVDPGIAMDLSDAFTGPAPSAAATPIGSSVFAAPAPDLQAVDDLIAPIAPPSEPPPGPDVRAAAAERATGTAVDLSLTDLMVAATEPAPAPAAAAEPPALPEAAAGCTHTVMVVDDSPTIRKILGLTLERAGYRVLAEPDGEAAMARLHDVIPDLILLDIAMPKIDGYEVCKRIKKNARTAKVPVVMLSGKDAFFDKVKGHMAGASEYLTKPFETPAVLAVVTSYCRKASEVVHG
jgi:CheY-like chemotaxis protein/tetratricopeptide (TPR) repeat protein